MSESNDVKNAPKDKVIAFLKRLYPNGTVIGNYFKLGNIKGDKGTSLSYDLNNNFYKDYAQPHEKGGNIAHLLAAKNNITYAEALSQAQQALGLKSGSGSATKNHKPNPGKRAVMPVPDNAPGLPVAIGAPHHSRDKTGYILRKIYDYRDLEGGLLLHITRFENPDVLTRKGKPEKLVLPLSYYAEEGWCWKGLGLPQNPLYGLTRLAVCPDAYVLVVEGEKAADAAALLFPDFVPIAWLGGVGQLGKADFSPLRGRKVVYWPDADEAGAKSVEVVARLLTENCVGELRVVNLPAGLPSAWDVADPVPAGVDLRELLRKATPPAAIHRALLRDLSLNTLIERVFRRATLTP